MRRPIAAFAPSGRVLVLLLALVFASAPPTATTARANGSDLQSWLAQTAANALKAAEPHEDPALAGIEAFNLTLDRAIHRAQQGGPAWLRRIDVGVKFDAELRPRYDLATTQPILHFTDGHRLVMNGRFIHSSDSVTGGDFGVSYDGRMHGHDVVLGLHGGVEDRRPQDLRRFIVGGRIDVAPLSFRARLFDDVPNPALAGPGAERRLDGYDLEVGGRLPFLSWGWFKANRFWQIAVDNDHATTTDRFSLRLTPLAPIEIETGTTGRERDRTWFAQLRVRFRLGE